MEAETGNSFRPG